MHCVDLGESFPTSIYLQHLASIQPRMSLISFFSTIQGFFFSPVYPIPSLEFTRNSKGSRSGAAPLCRMARKTWLVGDGPQSFLDPLDKRSSRKERCHLDSASGLNYSSFNALFHSPPFSEAFLSRSQRHPLLLFGEDSEYDQPSVRKQKRYGDLNARFLSCAAALRLRFNVLSRVLCLHVGPRLYGFLKVFLCTIVSLQ